MFEWTKLIPNVSHLSAEDLNRAMQFLQALYGQSAPDMIIDETGPHFRKKPTAAAAGTGSAVALRITAEPTGEWFPCQVYAPGPSEDLIPVPGATGYAHFEDETSAHVITFYASVTYSAAKTFVGVRCGTDISGNILYRIFSNTIYTWDYAEIPGDFTPWWWQ